MTAKKIRSIFMIDPELRERAETLAKEQAISYSELIRRAILVYLGGDVTLEERIAAVEKELTELKKLMEG